jgi:hypothetical protein
MKNFKEIFKKIVNHDHFLPFILFTFIFTVYFSSSVGLMNSVDTPQFFTAEAILRNKNLDLSYFNNNPYYFVYPDVYYKDNQTLSFRGYLTSVLMIPFHLLANLIKNFVKVDNFPNKIKSDYFNYQLTVVSLFTFFSASGLTFIFLSIKKITKNRLMSLFLILLLAFGTYIWKYAACYTRHGLTIFLLGFSILSLLNYLESRSNHRRWLAVFLLLYSLSFGIDIFLFLSYSIFIFIFLILFHKEKIIDIKNFYIFLLPCIVIFFLILLNYYFYGTLFFNQNFLQPKIREVLGDKTPEALFSSPLLPVLKTVLFNNKKINESAFSNFNRYPQRLLEFGSVEYAKKYMFYGLFFISPYLLIIFFIILFIKKITRKKYISFILLFSFLIFFINLILNSKILGFWGGNQYDVRYFYPYTVLLIFPAVFVLQEILKTKNKLIKIFFVFAFIISSIFSLIMGWLGVINMYKPALTGERRIWMEIYDLPNQFFNHSFKEYLDATFMNRENFWIPIVLSFLFYLFYRLFVFLFYFLHHKKHRR